MKKVAIYTRISTTDKGQDLETQLLPLKEYANARDWEIFAVYEERISGSKESRPELQKLLSAAQKRKFDIALVFRFDRFARSSKQLINSLDFFQSVGIDFVSYQENIDTSSSTGKLMFALVSAFAEFERSIIQERVKAGLVKAKAQGKKLGRPKKKVDTARIKELRKQGLSVRKVAEVLGISKTMVGNSLSL
jgi:DNA invertase Pin-like site-specific DNA recombinase